MFIGFARLYRALRGFATRDAVHLAMAWLIGTAALTLAAAALSYWVLDDQRLAGVSLLVGGVLCLVLAHKTAGDRGLFHPVVGRPRRLCVGSRKDLRRRRFGFRRKGGAALRTSSREKIVEKTER